MNQDYDWESPRVISITGSRRHVMSMTFALGLVGKWLCYEQVTKDMIF